MANFRTFSSLAAFNSAKDSLPYPTIAKITEGTDTFVFIRHSLQSVKDEMYTVGNSTFRVGWSIVGGNAVLG